MPDGYHGFIDVDLARGDGSRRLDGRPIGAIELVTPDNARISYDYSWGETEAGDSVPLWTFINQNTGVSFGPTPGLAGVFIDASTSIGATIQFPALAAEGVFDETLRSVLEGVDTRAGQTFGALGDAISHPVQTVQSLGRTVGDLLIQGALLANPATRPAQTLALTQAVTTSVAQTYHQGHLQLEQGTLHRWIGRGLGAAAFDGAVGTVTGAATGAGLRLASTTLGRLASGATARIGALEGPTLREVTAGGGCFVTGTLVHTPEGPRPIETLKVGDRVLSQPEMQGEIAWRRVNETFVFDDKPVLEVAFTNAAGGAETLTATGNHPFWVKGEGWTAAELLKSGDVLELHDRSQGVITAIDDTGRIETVHNFEVDGFHTYYVGETGVWVHNTDCGRGLEDNLMKRPYISAEARRAVGEKPGWIDRAHLHHILSLNGVAGAERALVRTGQRILRAFGIDPIKGPENLVWAPNKGHTMANTERLVSQLERAESAGANRADILDILEEEGRRAQDR